MYLVAEYIALDTYGLSKFYCTYSNPDKAFAHYVEIQAVYYGAPSGGASAAPNAHPYSVTATSLPIGSPLPTMRN